MTDIRTPSLELCLLDAESELAALRVQPLERRSQSHVAKAHAAVVQARQQLDAEVRDAERFRKLCHILQGAYDGDTFEVDGLTVLCAMLSGFRSERQVKAEIIWRDERDEPLNLAAALDAVSLEG